MKNTVPNVINYGPSYYHTLPTINILGIHTHTHITGVSNK